MASMETGFETYRRHERHSDEAREGRSRSPENRERGQCHVVHRLRDQCGAAFVVDIAKIGDRHLVRTASQAGYRQRGSDGRPRDKRDGNA